MASLKVIHDPPKKNCVNCLDEFGYCQRPAPYGTKTKPLCRTHGLAKRNDTKRKRHRSTVEQQYGFEAGGYDRLKEYQGGKCAICQRATGQARNLAVDHNHAHCDTCKGKGSCGKGIRGLLCSRCNQLLGHLRDDLNTAARIYEYLSKPPYQTMMADREYLDQLEPDHPDSAWQEANPSLIALGPRADPFETPGFAAPNWYAEQALVWAKTFHPDDPARELLDLEFEQQMEEPYTGTDPWDQG